MENDVVKRVAIIAYSRRGMALAQKAAACFLHDQIRLCTAPRLLEESSLKEDRLFHPEAATGEYSIGELFGWADVMLFISALGIAVRKIAPFVKDKRYDPAVLCMDERGNYVIPLLSGHIGGANELAGFLAHELDSVAVITTATDINGRFSVDTWARKKGLTISDMKMAKAISAAILEQDISLESDFPIVSDYPPGCMPVTSGTSPYGILISWMQREPFLHTLRLIPPVIHLGIGCRKGVSKETISAAVESALSKSRADKRAVKGVYSIDLKKSEKGLLEYCQEMGWPFHVYTAKQLMQVAGDYQSSEFVRSITGADNICERSAMAEADTLILNKTSGEGVTVALAVENYLVEF